jgi:hypothetical protein
MNKLIPNFEERAKAAENINSFCAPVRLSAVFVHASQLTKTSCNQVPMTHEVTIQAGSKLRSQIGSTTVGTQTQDFLLVKASLPTRRRNVASPMMLQAASFAPSIMIGMIQSTLFATFPHSSIPSPPHLEYAPISEMLLRATTIRADSPFAVCTRTRLEILRTLKRGF